MNLPNPFGYPYLQRYEHPNACFAIAMQNVIPYFDFVGALQKAKIKDGIAFWETYKLFGLPFAAIIEGFPTDAEKALNLMLSVSKNSQPDKAVLFALKQRYGEKWHVTIVLVKDGHTCEVNSHCAQMRPYPNDAPVAHAIYVLMDNKKRDIKQFTNAEISHLLKQPDIKDLCKFFTAKYFDVVFGVPAFILGIFPNLDAHVQKYKEAYSRFIYAELHPEHEAEVLNWLKERGFYEEYMVAHSLSPAPITIY